MEAKLEARVRREKNKGYIRQLKAKGLIPGVLYGKNLNSIPVSLSAGKLHKILVQEGSNALINLKIKNNNTSKTYKVMVKAVQYDPLRRTPVHIDFYRYALKEKIRAEVAVSFSGSAPGVAAGGILNPVMRRVEVECLPREIPESITVDISNLDLGESITVSELVPPPGVTVIDDPDAPVVAVTGREAAEAETGAPAGEEEVEKVEETEEAETEEREIT
jgi:large subunit ribosomal protein L25